MESSRLGVPEAHLEQFAKAKRQQQFIYDVTGNLISRIKTKLDELSSFEGIGSRSVQELIDILEGRIESLKSDLSRRKMKVAFFGGTSSGKTTTLNAMIAPGIGRELLPSGMGDRTSCFVQIEKMTNDVTGKDDKGDSKGNADKDNSARVKREDQEETSYFSVREVESREKEASINSLMENKQPLNQNTLEDMCNANSGRSLDASYLIEIHLSEGDVKEDHLLNYDIQIMDCPGITKCRELGDKVKSFCADSDVHVLIVNPKTVMSPEERDHFVEVGKRLPKPDIIVGFTQWDLSARERRPEEVSS
ncbi:transmembrane GTPase fzo-like [Strongylocentrotus purpuratus]|uniref:Dynamin-type G domain-containing protein n=1 Tax=Strongylocentrotus purpuratus TaxID=7668 RepID=A0A7M7N3E9_STRPU|nr:transmembrane GTPase fzo-like [Strongylocentrotus purpuratus]